VVGAFALNCLIWSSTWMAIKVGLRGAPPMTAVGVRFAIAAALITAVVVARKLPVPRTRAFLRLGLFLAVCHLALPYVLVYWGEQHISSGLTAVLYSTMPFMVALLARAILGDPLPARKIAGIASGIAGVSLIFSDKVGLGGDGSAPLGIAAILLSVFFASLSSVVIKKHSSSYHPIVSLTVPFVVASLLVAAVAFPVERQSPLQFDGLTWFTILYLAIAGSFVAFAVFFWLMKRVDVTVVSYQTFIIPVLAVLWGWLFLDETVSSRVGAGTAFILAGIAVATFGRPRRSRA
jgi:putative membrane protein PagO